MSLTLAASNVHVLLTKFGSIDRNGHPFVAQETNEEHFLQERSKIYNSPIKWQALFAFLSGNVPFPINIRSTVLYDALTFATSPK